MSRRNSRNEAMYAKATNQGGSTVKVPIHSINGISKTITVRDVLRGAGLAPASGSPSSALSGFKFTAVTIGPGMSVSFTDGQKWSLPGSATKPARVKPSKVNPIAFWLNPAADIDKALFVIEPTITTGDATDVIYFEFGIRLNEFSFT